ncbi:MAG: HD domain-containing protein [Anaerolineales bacterium]|nr:MAG: HD domain-containing protein [Anaerolineales bacterium]
MKFNRIIYRIAQFWNVIRARPAGMDLEWALSKLTPEQKTLFTQLHQSEQAHSISVLRNLVQNNHSILENENQALVVAALLHDVGKTLYPIAIWERVLIVVSKALIPEQVKQWGRGQPAGWRRAFVVAEQHPEWGAQLAAQAGASALTVALIREHQNHCPQESVDRNGNGFSDLLFRLQAADREN